MKTLSPPPPAVKMNDPADWNALSLEWMIWLLDQPKLGAAVLECEQAGMTALVLMQALVHLAEALSD